MCRMLTASFTVANHARFPNHPNGYSCSVQKQNLLPVAPFAKAQYRILLASFPFNALLMPARSLKLCTLHFTRRKRGNCTRRDPVGWTHVAVGGVNHERFHLTPFKQLGGRGTNAAPPQPMRLRLAAWQDVTFLTTRPSFICVTAKCC